MAHYGQYPARPPLCTCPVGTWGKGPSAADRAGCAERAGFNVHPVLTVQETRALTFLHRPREAPMNSWTVPAVITRVIDGDTLVANLDLGWNVWMIDRRIRLAGVNCPELTTPEGVTARAFTVNTLNRLMPVGDSGPLAAHVTVVSHSLDKYGRVLGDVRWPAPGGTWGGKGSPGWNSLADLLLTAGHAEVMR